MELHKNWNHADAARFPCYGLAKAEDRIEEVVVEGQPLTRSADKLQALDVPVSEDFVAHARFDAGEDGDKAIVDSVPSRDVAGDIFLAGLAGMQVADGTAGFFGVAAGGFLELGGQTAGELAEVFEQDLPFPKQALEAVDEGDLSEGSAENEAVEAAENAGDLVSVFCYKTVHGSLLGARDCSIQPFYFLETTVSIL